MMTAQETMKVGTRLVELCRAGENIKAIDELYDANITSVEAMGGPGFEQVQSGIDTVKGKNTWWMDNHEVHGVEIDGPYPHEDRFVIKMSYDITPKMGPKEGQRYTMEEMGIYTVAGGKITKEEFCYAMSEDC